MQFAFCFLLPCVLPFFSSCHFHNHGFVISFVILIFFLNFVISNLSLPRFHRRFIRHWDFEDFQTSSFLFGFVWKCWVNIPNEIAIFHRDNDQQNHWVQWGTRHFQTHPFINCSYWIFLHRTGMAHGGQERRMLMDVPSPCRSSPRGRSSKSSWITVLVEFEGTKRWVGNWKCWVNLPNDS